MVARIEIAGGKTADPEATDLGFYGLFFKSEDGRRIAQFRGDGFTFNHLKPYSSWEQIAPEALRLWDLYVQTLQPEMVTRLALRYINRLDIPSPAKLGEYLTAPPIIPPTLPQELSSFLTQVVIHEPGAELAANISQTLDQSIEDSEAAVILDIDAYRFVELDPYDHQIQETLSLLHEFKNAIFFESVTETALKEYE